MLKLDPAKISGDLAKCKYFESDGRGTYPQTLKVRSLEVIAPLLGTLAASDD
jgi:hypothetical protein